MVAKPSAIFVMVLIYCATRYSMELSVFMVFYQIYLDFCALAQRYALLHEMVQQNGKNMPVKQPAIYIMANKRNGTIYTGVTSDLIKRVYEHKYADIAGFTQKHGCKYLVSLLKT